MENSLEDDDFIDDKVLVCETEIGIRDIHVIDYVPTEEFKIPIVNIKSEDSTELHISVDNVKVEDEENVDEIKIEFNNDLLFCEHCKVYYKYYCITCGMLVHILNKRVHSNTDIKIQEELPQEILEVKNFSGQLGIFVLKVIPKGVRFGPWTGLKTSECNWKVKGGRLMTSEDKSKFLNWMWYINPARSICEQNLLAFQYEGSLYYRSNRDIRVGEELLVYFGAEYEDSLNRDIEMDFMPFIENYAKDVFACTFCCLGFSTRTHLSKHKTVCLNVADNKFSIEELVQCPFCEVYLDVKEYSDYHMAFCSEQNVRECVPLTPNSQTVEGKICKVARRREYKCHWCKYKTTYKADLTSHTISQHCKAKTYICTICNRRFKTKTSFNMHMEYIHVKVEESGDQRCLTCNSSACACSKTKCQASFQTLTQTKELEDDRHKCVLCDYQADHKLHLDTNVKKRHLEGFDYRCEMCQFKTNQKVLFEYHLKLNHPKEYSNMCLERDYRTDQTKPFKKFNYKCFKCNYGTNHHGNFNTHIKTKHHKQFEYKCSKCNYQTNRKRDLLRHIKTIHLNEFDYRCLQCNFKTNQKTDLNRHIKAIHLKALDYMCLKCNYKTHRKILLNIHIKTRHLKEFDYKCLICNYKTNRKTDLNSHVKTKHRKEFDYKCLKCNYETSRKKNLNTHIKTKHLKEFDYYCKSGFESYIKAQHL